MNRRSPIVKALISAIADNNLEELEDLLKLPNIQQDATHSLGFAACQGKIGCVQLLLPHSRPGANNSGALRMAAAKGFSDCVRALLPFSNANALDGEALYVAAQNNHLECVKALLPHTEPGGHLYALFLATIHQHRECVAMLLDVPCRAQDVLDILKRDYSDSPKKWCVLEEEMQRKNIYLALSKQEYKLRERKM